MGIHLYFTHFQSIIGAYLGRISAKLLQDRRSSCMFLSLSPYEIFARVVVIFTAMPIHEYAHGWAAAKLGDETAYYDGRLDLNPLAHLDPVGTLLLLFTGFGWAKPVRVNPRNFNRKVSMRAGMALTALAGPVANILMAFVVLVVAKLLNLLLIIVGARFSMPLQIVYMILSYMVSINVGLAVFNLLPIPPLDGYSVASYFIPAKWEYTIAQYQQYIFIGLLLVIMFTPILTVPLNLLAGLVYRLLSFATGWIDLLAGLIL